MNSNPQNFYVMKRPKFKSGQKVLFTPHSGNCSRELTVEESARSKSISLFTGQTVSSVVYLCRDVLTGRSCHFLERELVRA